MSILINGGNPAFPRTVFNGDREPQNGMTKREFFSLTILNGLISDQSNRSHVMINKESFVESSIKLADELLKQLNEEK